VSYKNRWVEVEDAAKGLEQTARVLARAEDVPPRYKENLAVLSGDLGKEATRLKEAARARNAREVDASLQRLNKAVRDLHAE
jgi:hypothetical protein